MYKLPNINIRYGAKCKVHKKIFMMNSLSFLPYTRCRSELAQKDTVKLVKIWTSEKIAVIILKLELSFYCRVMGPKDADWLANSLDPDQAPLGAV